jgi:hypothetical protein
MWQLVTPAAAATAGNAADSTASSNLLQQCRQQQGRFLQQLDSSTQRRSSW